MSSLRVHLDAQTVQTEAAELRLYKILSSLRVKLEEYVALSKDFFPENSSQLPPLDKLVRCNGCS